MGDQNSTWTHCVDNFQLTNKIRLCGMCSVSLLLFVVTAVLLFYTEQPIRLSSLSDWCNANSTCPISHFTWQTTFWSAVQTFPMCGHIRTLQYIKAVWIAVIFFPYNRPHVVLLALIFVSLAFVCSFFLQGDWSSTCLVRATQLQIFGLQSYRRTLWNLTDCWGWGKWRHVQWRGTRWP